MIIKNIKEAYTMKRNLWQTFKNACVIFTAIIFFFYLIGLIFFPDMIPSLSTIGVFFIFSLALAFVNEIFFVKKFSFIVKCLLHFFATLALILLSLAISGKFASSGFAILILSFVFAILYWIGASIAIIINGATKKKKNTEQKYDRMFN